MFHPKQSGKPALISRVLGKRIGILLAAVARHPLMIGALFLLYMVIITPGNSELILAALSASEFPETACAALLFSALLMAVVYAVICFARQILTAFRNDE
ncbi:hypothetical protein [Atlantibacter sp.]|uniref:hypothetical protein n=1 Tax=Atlantibacter sp. TaxID=1903473 RepID=UPI0028AE3275|nr:hypothetical protein [Atlantibacter sp.]